MRDKRIGRSGFVFVIALFVLLAMIGAAGMNAISRVNAAGETATLAVSPTSQTALAGEIFTVDILVDTDSQPIAGVDVMMTFDTIYLEALDIAPRPDLSTLKHYLPQDGAGVFDETAVLSRSQTTGLLEFGAVNYTASPTPTIGSSFTGSITPFATVTFRVRETAPAGTSTHIAYHYTGAGQTADSNILKDPEGAAAVDILASTNTGQSQVVVTIPLVDTTPPAVLITDPQDGSTLPRRGKVLIQAQASDENGIAEIAILIDGDSKAVCSGVTTCSYNWSVNQVSSGQHTITATAVDGSANGNTNSTSITVTKP